MKGASIVFEPRPGGMSGEEIARACKGRQRGEPWDYLAAVLDRRVQQVKDAVWEAESLGFQLHLERLARVSSPGRTAMFLRQCAQALEAE